MMARLNGRQAAPVALTIAMSLLAGCSMFHENVKGGFLCQAPKGVCAPSTSIDNAALAQISAEHGADIVPAGDIIPASDMAMAGEASGRPAKRSAKHFRRADIRLAAAGMPEGTGRPALWVVHPAWRDSQGRLHARTAEYAYVDAVPAQGFAAPEAQDVAARGDGADRSLLGAAERAPEVGGMTMATSPVSAPLANVAPPATLAANPTDTIRAKVAAILAKAPKPIVTAPAVAARPPSMPVASGSVGPIVQSGGIFPPAGS
jgi:hypothetical protein